MLDFSIKTLSNGTKELYVDEKLIASGTQKEILQIMRLMTQQEAPEKASNDEASGDKVLVKQCNDKIKDYKGKKERQV